MSFDVLNLARPGIVAMEAYQSARSQSHAAAGKVYLDANELGDSETPELSRYPEPQPPELVAELTKRFDVPAGNLFLGAGVDDAIDALLRVFCEARQDQILITPPTYGFYKVAAAVQGVAVQEAPLTPGSFDFVEADILAKVTPRTKLVFLCNPNNPTGNSYQSERLARLAAMLAPQALLVVDEAYIEFSHQLSLVKAAAQPGNLVVLRTLSKAWGLAGVRLGAAVTDAQVIALLHKVRAPYPISRPAAAAGALALSQLPAAKLNERVERLRRERDQLAGALARVPLVRRVFPSDANFLLVETSDSASFMRRCRDAGFVVRDRSKEFNLQGCIRISVGSAADNAGLLAALTQGER